jgi:electron-transferring-flavoprotein dehydrogenase
MQTPRIAHLQYTEPGMSEVERDVMEYDVVTVGAGPAGLSFAIRLKQLKPELSVCVIEKGATVGAHILSGAVIEPGPLDALLPGWRASPPPVCVPAGDDEFWLLSKTGGRKLPVPPGMKNHGNFIVSLGALCAWLAPQAEALGVEIYPGFAAAATLHDDDGRVAGVRIGDMGVAKDGAHKPGFTAGIDIKAKVTVFAEGARGSLTKQLVKRFGLDADSDPQAYSIGIKELWQVPAGRATPGRIVHTLGWPASNDIYGGSFLYHLDGDRVALGYVSGLDYSDPEYKPWEAFQQWKNHPMIASLLEGGSILSAGARAIVTGGWQSLPKVKCPAHCSSVTAPACSTCRRSRVRTRRSAAACSPPNTGDLARSGRLRRETARLPMRWPSCARCATSNRGSSVACGSAC